MIGLMFLGLVAIWVTLTVLIWRFWRRARKNSGGEWDFNSIILTAFVGLVVLMFPALTGCGNISIKWQEEVRMADGNILLLDRTTKGVVKGGDWAGPAWDVTEMTIKVVKLPANWQQPPLWHEGYVPILLDYQPEGHIWSVVATFVFCDAWYKLGRPPLPYVQYQSRDGGPWVNVPLEERLIGRKTNLLTGPSSGGEPKLVTAEEIDRRNRSADDKYYKILDKWRTNC